MGSQSHDRKEAQRQMRADDRQERSVVSVAHARFLRVSARKARYVADLVRGMSVSEAMETLKFTFRPSASPIIERLLKSAVANVSQADLKTDDLIPGTIQVSPAGMLKRFRPRAYGRAAQIRKRLCHVSMELVAPR